MLTLTKTASLTSVPKLNDLFLLRIFIHTFDVISDGWTGSQMAERCRRPKLRLHVQASHHRQLECGKDIVSLSLRR